MESGKIINLLENNKKYKVPNALIDLFFPNQGSEKRKIAAALLCEIRDRKNTQKPFSSWDGREFCKKNCFNYWTYQDVREQLEKAGVLRKNKNGSEYDISLGPLVAILQQFEDFLNFKTFTA